MAINSTEVVQKKVLRSNLNLLLWYGFLGVALFIGLIGFFWRVSKGLSITNLTSEVSWGGWVVFYVYFIGLSIGTFFISTLVYVFNWEKLKPIGKDSIVISVITMLMGLIFILLDLGHMERFWHSLLYFNPTSVLAWEVRIYGVYFTVLLIYMYFALRADWVITAKKNNMFDKIVKILKLGSSSREKDKKILKILGILGIFFAILSEGGSGLLFAVVKARVYWNSALFPVMIFTSAIISGLALLLVSYLIKTKVFNQKREQKVINILGGLLIFTLFLDIALQIFEVVVSIYSLEEQLLMTVSTIYLGDFAFLYWGVQLVIGIILPIVLYLFFKKSNKAMFLAGVGALIGVVAVRFNLIIPAQITPLLTGLPRGQYSPSLLEWALTIGIIGLGLLLYTLALRLLPLRYGEDE